MQVTEQLQNAHGAVIHQDQSFKGEKKHKPLRMPSLGAQNADHGVVLDRDRNTSISVI